MSPFEFICAFYSVVLGIAVAQLMTSVGRLLEVGDQVRTYWVHSLWVVIVLIVDVNSWWTMWEVRSAKSWSFVSFSLLVGFVASLYLVTVLLFPLTRSQKDRSTSTLIIIRTAASFSGERRRLDSGFAV